MVFMLTIIRWISISWKSTINSHRVTLIEEENANNHRNLHVGQKYPNLRVWFSAHLKKVTFYHNGWTPAKITWHKIRQPPKNSFKIGVTPPSWKLNWKLCHPIAFCLRFPNPPKNHPLQQAATQAQDDSGWSTRPVGHQSNVPGATNDPVAPSGSRRAQGHDDALWCMVPGIMSKGES